MQLIKYDLRAVLISYMFQHRGAIFRESFTSKYYKPSTLNKVSTAHIGAIKIFPDDGTPMPKRVGY